MPLAQCALDLRVSMSQANAVEHRCKRFFRGKVHWGFLGPNVPEHGIAKSFCIELDLDRSKQRE